MTKFLACVWFLVYFTVACSGLRNVTVSKCCKLNEYLTNNNTCVPGEKENIKWTMRIYYPAKNTFIKNKLPQNWIIKENFKPDCTNFLLSESYRSNYIPFVNGSVFSVELNELIPPGNWCLDYNSAILCKKPDHIQKATVKKCCPPNAIFSEKDEKCISMKGNDYIVDVGSEKTLIYSFPGCKDLVVAGKLHENELNPNGSLYLKENNLLLESGDFCLEHIFEKAGGSPSIFTCKKHIPAGTVIKEPAPTDLRFILYPIGLALGAIFLAATLVAGSLLPANHHVLHWRCQTNHVACLLVGNVLLCITQLSSAMDKIPCFMIATSMHFLFLAAFFWLNTMCFNIWWTFRDLRPQSTEKSQERLRLRLYQLYAWGGPLIIAGTAAILDLVPSDQNSGFLKPNFGANKCWFDGDKEIFTFFYGPIGTLLVINLALFGLTARELTCGLWKRELVKSTTERAALGRVCMKLVVVMGVTWICDIVSWAAGGRQEIWYITDIINCLQGVFIFIVVGLQPQVLTAVKRLWCLRKHRQNGMTGRENHHSSSSQGPPSMGDTITNSVNNTTKSVPIETSC